MKFTESPAKLVRVRDGNTVRMIRLNRRQRRQLKIYNKSGYMPVTPSKQ